MAGREERDHEFVDPLDVGVCIRYRFNLDRGRVTAFTVQLELYDEADGRWRPAVRYDDAHGAPHRDVLDWSGRVIDKLWMEPGIDNDRAMAEAARDLKVHRATYAETFWRTKP